MSKKLLLGLLDERPTASDVLNLSITYASNNFPGWIEPEIFWSSMFPTILRSSPRRTFYHSLRCLPKPVAKAFVRKLLQLTVKEDDAELLKVILAENFSEIDVNAEIVLDPVSGGKKFTLIEYSSRSNAVSVTRILRNHSADVNKTYSDEPRNGALNGAIFHLPKISKALVDILISADARIHPKAIIHLVSNQRVKAVEHLMNAKAARCHREWSKNGIFHAAIKLLDVETSMKVIDVMMEVRVDINFRLQPGDDIDNHREPHLATVLDVAAYRGIFDLAERLLSAHALLTQDTLSCAIRSGNHRLITCLLKQGAEVDDITSFGSSPFAEAVRTKNDSLIDTFVTTGALSRLKEKGRFKATIEAASEVGNISLIRKMLEIREDMGVIARVFYGLPLATAVRNDQTDIALLLIEAGAEINDEILSLAIDRHSLSIARAILKASVTFSQAPIMLKAVKWGEFSLIKDLIAAGADVNSPPGSAHNALSIAIDNSDDKLVKALLDAEADVRNQPCGKDGKVSHTALSSAIDNMNFEMVQLLFRYGADPCDSLALHYAIEQYISGKCKSFDLLLSEFDERYPYGEKRYGSEPLKLAISIGNPELTERIGSRTSFNSFSCDDEWDYWSYSDGSWAEKLSGFQATTPLAIAILKHCDDGLEEVQWLQNKRVKPDSIVTKSPCLTALALAAKSQSVEMIKLLLGYGANVNHPAAMGSERTALQQAAETGNFEITKLLLDYEADVNAAPARSNGGTALQFAARGGFLRITLLLLQAGADVNAPPAKINGRTALEGAAEWGRLDIVYLLLEKGAKTEGDSYRYFKSAVQLAEGNGHFGVADLLKSHSSPVLSGSDGGTVMDPEQ